MSEETTTTTLEEPKEAVEPQAEEPQEPTAGKDDPLLDSLWADLGVVAEEKEIEPAPEAEPEPEPEAEAEAEPEATPEPEAEEEGRKFSIRDQPYVDQNDLDGAVKKAVHDAIPEPVATPEPEPVADSFEENLVDEQKEELELARFAEAGDPEKFKDLRGKFVSYYKKLDEYVQSGLNDDSGRAFDEHDSEFQDWMTRNRPEFTEGDRQKAVRSMIEESATKKARAEMEGQYADLERRQKVLETKPKIEETINAFRGNVYKLSGNEAIKVMNEKGYEEAVKKYPLEARIYNDSVTHASSLANEYLGFANGISSYDESNEDHVWLLNFINRNGEWFEDGGGKARTRDGKQFVSRAKYADLANNGQANDYWTFSHDDILDLLAANAVHHADASIKNALETAKAYGFEMPDHAVSAEEPKPEAQEEDIQPVNPPKSSPSPSPGTADREEVVDKNHPGIDVASVLGMS